MLSQGIAAQARILASCVQILRTTFGHHNGAPFRRAAYAPLARRALRAAFSTAEVVHGSGTFGIKSREGRRCYSLQTVGHRATGADED